VKIRRFKTHVSRVAKTNTDDNTLIKESGPHFVLGLCPSHSVYVKYHTAMYRCGSTTYSSQNFPQVSCHNTYLFFKNITSEKFSELLPSIPLHSSYPFFLLWS